MLVEFAYGRTVLLGRDLLIPETDGTFRLPVAASEDAFRERTIEVSETDEEAVVEKEARIVEEVVVSKDAVEHEETVRDTVRRTDVDHLDRAIHHAVACLNQERQPLSSPSFHQAA
ncbi:MAG: YsnF/AvaK domain-containing protein [Actinomycetota bacterium]|nr:YsnF/AvaK domain-containing protein [Actinomycetota bacterium]